MSLLLEPPSSRGGIAVSVSNTSKAAEQVDAQAVLSKPFELGVLLETVRQLAGPALSAAPEGLGRHISVSRLHGATRGFAIGDS